MNGRSWNGLAVAGVCMVAAIGRMIMFLPASDWRDQGDFGPTPSAMVVGLIRRGPGQLREPRPCLGVFS